MEDKIIVYVYDFKNFIRVIIRDDWVVSFSQGFGYSYFGIEGFGG